MRRRRSRPVSDIAYGMRSPTIAETPKRSSFSGRGDSDAEVLASYRLLEQGRWRAEIHLGTEVRGSSERFDGENIEVVALSQVRDRGRKRSQADEPDLGWKFQDGIASLVTSSGESSANGRDKAPVRSSERNTA